MAFVPVTFSEYQSDGPHESVGEDGVFRATRRVVCAYSRRHELADYLWGTTYPYAEKTQATMRNISDISPVPAQLQGGFSEEYETRDGSEIVTAVGSLAVYEAAVLTLQYSNKVDAVSDEPGHNPRLGPGILSIEPEGDLFTEEFTPTATYETMAEDQLGWANAISTSGIPFTVAEIKRVTADEAMPVLILGGSYTLTWYRVKGIKSEVISLAGFCNKSAVATKKLGYVFPAETLLYQAAPLRPGNRDLSTVSLRFEYKAAPTAPDANGNAILQGWNYFWRTETQKFERIWTIPSGFDAPVQIKPYRPVDLEPLFDFSEVQQGISTYDGFPVFVNRP
ncbi:hypothetical protein LCGC14_0357470 [marine sediment metagenome]|uniref:Uncharacterized protein n=1 Tax=marine sediment metagenome TaxID=412755 RepID=A0A0F9WHB9_9ZZZZ